MKNSKLFFWGLLIVYSTLNICHAQKLVTPNSIVENHILSSKFLGEDRSFSVYVPDNYQNTKNTYPVLYIIDGQRYFLNGVLYQKTLGWQEKSPDFIVVGIHTDNRKRRKLLNEKSKSFIQFLEQELIAHIELNYRTSSIRFFFGWEMAGGLAIDLLAQPQQIFNGYFIASPTHINDLRLNKLKESLVVKKTISEFIYTTLSPVETWSVPSLQNLGRILEKHVAKDFNWEYKSLKGENHHSTPTKTVHEGLNKYFWDYAYLRFYSLEEFKEFGGIIALKKHYKIRGEKYHIKTDIHKDTKHFLLLQAMKEDDFELFESFMMEFNGYYKTKNRDLWFNRYAQFYLKNKNPNKAIEVLQNGLDKFNNSPKILSSLGDSYLMQKKVSKAKRYYKKAIQIAKENEDSDLEVYKLKLKNI